MTVPVLPVEIYSEILKHISTQDDNGINLLVAFQQCNSLLQAAALAPEVWEPHYRTRYFHCVEEKERVRREAAGSNWRELYIQRRRLDRTALQLLDEIRKDPRDRLRKATIIADLSFDIWDALRLESNVPIPNCFQRERGQDNIPIKDASPRRFWANVILGVIARRHMIGLWYRVFREKEDIPFEEALAALSTMFDVSIKEVTIMLDGIFEKCKQDLLAANVCLDPNHFSYDVWDLCTQIRSVLRDMGFRLASTDRFHRILGQFPHGFLQPGQRDTIPMSLVYVFIAVCRRLGIRAYPINSPGAVLACVSTSKGDRIVDMRSAKRLVPPEQLPELLPPLSQTTVSSSPANSTAMLSRAFENLVTFIQFERTFETDSRSFDRREVAYYTVLLGKEFDRNGQVDFILPMPPASKIFDHRLVMLDTLCPLLTGHRRNVVERLCLERIQEEELGSTRVQSRKDSGAESVTYFIGLVFRHAHLHYIGCIYGWDPTCEADENWITEMQVDRLAHGRNQPFYKVFTTDARTRYVAQENVRFVKPSMVHDDIVQLYESNCTFGRHFSDISDGGERLSCSEELKYRYPDDEEYGKIWLQNRPDEEGFVSLPRTMPFTQSVFPRMHQA